MLNTFSQMFLNDYKLKDRHGTMMRSQSQINIIAHIKYRLMKKILGVRKYSNRYNT